MKMDDIEKLDVTLEEIEETLKTEELKIKIEEEVG